MQQQKMISVKRFLAVFFMAALVAGCSDQSKPQAEVKATGQTATYEVAKKVAPGVNLEPGMWEITTVMEAPNMPMAMPASTVQQCLTEEDFVPKGEYSGPGCDVANLKVVGNTVSYDLKCNSGGSETVSSARITYAGTTMEGTFDMKVSGQASMQMTSKLSGKRIGPCN